MKNSSLAIFSIYQNVKKVIEKEKYDTTIFKSVSAVWYNKSNEFIKTNCKRIFNDVENNYYTHNDIVIFILTNAIYDNKCVALNKINYKNIKQNMKRYSKKCFLKDKDFIKRINAELGFKNISEYMIINDDGENIIYSLIIKKHISPILFLQYRKKCLTINEKNTILKNENYLKFEKYMNIINKHFRGG
ncbi:MAG: hypothetical protein WC260_01710 [Candidatus Pacearchaeota archaeon]